MHTPKVGDLDPFRFVAGHRLELEHATLPQLQQIMGHVNAETYQNYINEHVGADVETPFPRQAVGPGEGDH